MQQAVLMFDFSGGGGDRNLTIENIKIYIKSGQRKNSGKFTKTKLPILPHRPSCSQTGRTTAITMAVR